MRQSFHPPAPPKKPIGLGDAVAFVAKPLAWALWYVSCGYVDYRHCAACDKERARLNEKFPGVFGTPTHTPKNDTK